MVNLKRANKMCRVLEYYYSKAPHYHEAMEVIKPILLDEEPDLTRYLVKQLSEALIYTYLLPREAISPIFVGHLLRNSFTVQKAFQKN